MKPLIFIVVGLTCSAMAQDKPRIFVQGKGSQDVTTSTGRWSSRSTIDSHDEGMEVTKDLQKNCAGAIVTLTQSNADYTVILNRESKHNRGLLRTNSQVQVANRLGDILGTSATRTVGSASKDACQLILADWSQHGRTPVPDSPTSAPAPAAIASAPAEGARVQTISAIQPEPPQLSETTGAANNRTAGGGARAEAATNMGDPARTTEATAEISSDPSGADIEIDGSFVGSTPSSLEIATGEHTLSVSKKGYKPWQRTLKSSTGNIKIAAALEPSPLASVGTVPAAAQTSGPDPSPENQPSPSVTGTVLPQNGSRSMAATATAHSPEAIANSPTAPPEETLIGVLFAGNPSVRHDGVEISGVLPKGPADNIDIRAGDVLLAIDAHYLFTIDEVRAELLRYKSGARVLIRYRHNQFISENYLTLR